jgi:ADP-heptose:LPS heptosyltransferase
MKTVLVLRWGGYGDAVMISPVFPLLKREGYHVTTHLSEDCMKVLRGNPYIDKIILHKRDSVKNEDLGKYWEEISQGYDRFINFSGTIEEALLKREISGNDEYFLPKDERHKKCNKNYYDHTLEHAGFKVRGMNGELHFTKKEHREMQSFLKKYKDKFIVLWSLSGSSFHKAYPYTEYVACEFLERYPDTIIITVGGIACQLLEWEHPRTICKSDKFDMRKSMLLTKYADLVIGVETGVLNAAGCYDTPKIILLSHSSEENLTKYWKNCYPLTADVPCYPCHQLHYSLQSCPLDELEIPLCISELKPMKVLNTMEKIYKDWKFTEETNKALAYMGG